MTGQTEYTPGRSLTQRVLRRVTQWRTADALAVQTQQPIVSFTFDDFPKSAADVGADIIESAGGKATYYACTSLSGTKNITGELFDETDIQALLKAGHEIGAHTHSHIDCAKTAFAEIDADIKINLKRLHDMGASDVRQFAYPYGETQFAVKLALRKKFETARGILAGKNGARSDRMQLRALQLTHEDWTTGRAAKAIEAAAKSPTWIIIFTHDVQNVPSPYGTKTETLKRLTQTARDSGADILTISDAMKTITASQHA